MSEYCVSAVQVRAVVQCDEEPVRRPLSATEYTMRDLKLCVLTAIHISPSICRTHQARRIHLTPIQILIFELFAVDACTTTGAIAIFYVTALYHELVYNSVEGYFGVGKAIVLAGAQLSKATRVVSIGAWREGYGMHSLFTCSWCLIGE